MKSPARVARLDDAMRRVLSWLGDVAVDYPDDPRLAYLAEVIATVRRLLIQLEADLMRQETKDA